MEKEWDKCETGFKSKKQFIFQSNQVNLIPLKANIRLYIKLGIAKVFFKFEKRTVRNFHIYKMEIFAK